MRWLLGIVGLLVVVWTGGWFYTKSALETAVTRWFTEAAAQGRAALPRDVTVRGYPYRVDLTVEGLALTDGAGTAFEAPFVQVFALAYKPWHLVAVLADSQTLRLPGQDIALTSGDLRASARAAPESALPLQEVRLTGAELTATSSLGWSGAMGEVRFVFRDDGTATSRYETALELLQIDLDPALAAGLATPVEGAVADLPARVDVVRASLTLQLTAPLDRYAGERRPQLERLDLSDSLLSWGALAISAKGSLVPDAAGFAQGRIAVQITNWDRLPPLLVAMGAVKPELAPTIGNMLKAAAAGPEPAMLVLNLDMKDGTMSLGPLPLGPAPRLIAPSG